MYEPSVIVTAEIVVLIIFWGGWLLYKRWFLLIPGILISLALLFTLYFFRNPERIIPGGNNIIVAPADGRIVDISKMQSVASFSDEFIKISIYLSLFDVHMNRIPVSGEIFFIKYKKGRFYPAFRPKSSVYNESNLVGIETGKGRIFVKQIAGMAARRIVCNINKGDEVKKGERFGMIRFGSRVDLFLPSKIDLKVEKGDRVRAGESIIGEFHEE